MTTPIWLVVPDPFSARLFFDTGILDELRKRAGELLTPLLERLRHERPTVALGNTQMHSVVPFVVAARRASLPVVGHIASWDHTVGKGIVPPDLRRYVVQNDVMRDALVRYRRIDATRIVVTGWPQTDVFHRRRRRADFDAVVR